MKTNNIDITTVQETKLANHHKTPTIPQYRTDRSHKKGGGLITFVKHNINYTPLNTPNNINRNKTEIQTIKIRVTQTKHLHITNIYSPPRDTTNPNHGTENTDIINKHLHPLNKHRQPPNHRRQKRSLKPMALTHRKPPWVIDSRHNSKLQLNHTKHKHTNPYTTARKPKTHLTRHQNHDKLTTKKH